jgi:hypothetical protein
MTIDKLFAVLAILVAMAAVVGVYVLTAMPTVACSTNGC